MNQTLKDQLWIVLVSGLVFFTGLGATGLWDLDEPLYASCAREMIERNDWVVPVYNGDYFFDKPPLMFWLMMGGTALFGQNEFAVRFASALIGVLTAWVVYHLGRWLFDREAGFWAGLITATTVIFTVSARAATVDAALTLVSLLAIAAFVAARREWFDPEARPLGRPTAWLLDATAWAMMGVAVLAKGPVGLLLPAATIGLFLMIRNASQAGHWGLSRFSCNENGTVPFTRLAVSRLITAVRATAAVWHPWNFSKSLWQMRPLTGVVVVALVALPWFVWVDLRTDGAWLSEFFGKYNLGPFVKPFMGHHGPFFYHFLVILIGFFPWSLFLAPTLYHAVRRAGQGDRYAPAAALALAWVGVWFVFWSLCSTKLPHYVLPAYPALALLTGCFLAEWRAQPARFTRAWSRNAAITLVVVGLLLGIGVAVAAAVFVPGEEIIALVGLPLVVGGAVCWRYHRRRELGRMLPAFAATGVVFLVGLFTFAAARVDRHQHSPALAAEVRQFDRAGELAAYRFLQASMVYYAGGNVPQLEGIDSVRDYLARSPEALIVTLSSHEAELREKLGMDLRTVSRRPRFLGRGEVVLLGRADHPVAPHTAARVPESR